MSKLKTIDFIYGSHSDSRASDIWEAIKNRGVEDESISASGSWRSHDMWKRFGWGLVSTARIRPFKDNSGPERWTVPDLPHIEIRYDREPFNDAVGDDRQLEAIADDLINLVTYIYTVSDLRPEFVYGVTGLHQTLLAGNEVPLPVTAESLAENRIGYATWLMLFPPAMVETYGRETLLEAPAWHVEELDDGGILLVSTPNPTYPGETAAIDDHLGIDAPPELKDHQY